MIEAAGIRLDAGLIPGLTEWLDTHAAQAPAWFDEMARLESGAIANPDEGRMVGHYWLRAPGRAPRPELRQAIEQTVVAVRAFAADVHAGRVAPPAAPHFKNVLVIGIGGSALGPQLVADALGTGRDRMRPFFCDNTDPDGMDRLFESLAAAEGGLAATLAVVISKSGGTKETRNGMLESAHAWRRAGLEFPAHAVAVTGAGSELDRLARSEGWRAIFPMWDWVGGRTSVTSAVGLLPAALQGIDVEAFLDGARDMDEATRATDLHTNMAAVLAAAWHVEGAGRGERDMVILPYRDRLVLLSRYLQQLVMESLGKELDRAGRAVHQGIAVYGNKGSTDQHAYVQQLRDGRHNFFVNFVHVLRDREGDALLVEPDVTSGDYLFGFLMGTRRALAEKGRGSLLLSLDELTPRTLGALIALYERAVGLYAAMIDVNAYHQPGVEAGKKAAGDVLDLQRRVLAALRADRAARTADELAAAAGGADNETVWWILEHLAANPGRGVRREAGGRYRLA